MNQKIIIIGCGFGGVALAIALRKAGIRDFTILERAADVGGVWRDNTYPGAACDVVSRLYSFSFEQDYEWSTAFAPQDEILTYLRRCVDKYGVRPHVRCNVEVARAEYDEAALRWRVFTTAGETLEADVLVSAVGLFNRALVPEIPGRAGFRGPQFHSAKWDHSAPLAGKRVAVIGNGASAVQFVPRVARAAARLDLFMRTPQYVFPKTFFPGTGEWDAWLQKRRWLRPLARLKIFLMFERFVFNRLVRPHLRLKGEEGFRKLLEARIPDPELRRKLTPDYALGCKRLLASDEWWEAIVRPNLSVIDTPIERIEATGVRTRDGRLHEADTIIYGTGFTPSAFLTPMRINGLGGRDLNEAWREGAEAYLGISVAGFPNFFMLYGPNTNSITSIIFMLECQAHYIVECLKALAVSGAQAMTVRAEVQDGFVRELQERLAKSVPAMAGCHSYFKQENGRITTQWPGFSSEYWLRTRRVKRADYEFLFPHRRKAAA